MVVLITGASKGIGYETVKKFNREGIDKIIAISRDADKLKKLKTECEQINEKSQVHILPFDLKTLLTDSQSFIDIISDLTSNIDIIINNAGYLINKPFEQFSIKEVEDIHTMNFLVPATLIKILMPFLKKSKLAHVVNISSMGGFQGSSKYPGLTYYSSSKAALACLTECLSEEYKDYHITFNCLALGAVQTEMLEAAFPGYKAPLKAEEMAKFIYDFSVNGWKYMQGKIIPVSKSNP